MSETNNNINFLSNEKLRKNPWIRRVVSVGALLGALAGTPKEISAKNENKAETQSELVTTLKDGEDVFQNGDDKKNKLRSKEEMTIDFISNNLYINGVSVNSLNAVVKEENNSLYSAELEHEFLEGPRKLKLTFGTKYENNNISFDFKDCQIFVNGKRVLLPTNKTIEIDPTTHNNYDVRTVGNGKRENFNIVYNEYKTKQAIENIVKEKTITPQTKFERISEFENTQLTGLNTPYLGKEVFKDGDLYFRTLFYSTNGKKFDVTNIYFNPNGEFNAEKTLENKAKLNILGIDVEYDIKANKDIIAFTITEQSKQELIEKVRQDRKTLIETINNTPVADFEVFSGLNKIEKAESFQFDSQIIGLDPVSGIYTIKLNNDEDKTLDPIYCTVNGENVQLVDETGRSQQNVYFNYETKNKKSTNYYRINKGNDNLLMTKISKKMDNPKEMLPHYSGDGYLVNFLRKSGNLNNYEGGYLNYFDSKGNLVAKMPYDKQEDGSYKFNEEKYHTKIEALKLYKYSGFGARVSKIDEYALNLGITDAEIREIFEKSLKSDGLDFDQNVVEIRNPETGESIYCKLDKNDRIERENGLYGIVENRINFMLNRLKLAETINNSHIWWKNGKEYKDFQQFVGGESGIGKQIISPEQLRKFISGETNEIVVKIIWGQGQSTDVVYTADGKNLKTRLKSGEGKGSIFLNNQWYSLKTNDKNGDVIVDPKEERK